MHVILHEDRAATVSNNGNDTYMVNAAHPYPGRLEYERGGEVEYPPGKRDHSRILQCLGLRDLENAFCDYAIASKKVRETHTTTRTHTQTQFFTRVLSVSERIILTIRSLGAVGTNIHLCTRTTEMQQWRAWRTSVTPPHEPTTNHH